MLEQVNLPKDIKKLNIKQLNTLCGEIREQIIFTVNKNGGHLSSNLGTVELILALNKVFNPPKDKLIYDVGHQCYTHKIITGRKDGLINIRQSGGLSGFLNPAESEYDQIYAGHSGTSLSHALGMCRARDLKGEDYNVVAVIGDGSLGSGMALEALNDIGNSKTRLIIVLNDNEMSIEKNVGAISRHLRKLRISRSYISLKKGLNRFIFSIPLLGRPLKFICDQIKKLIKIFMSKSIFDKMGITYAGAFDGNDIGALIKAFGAAAETDNPLIVHIHTKKGKGYKPAEENPEKYHSVKKGFLYGQSPFTLKAGELLCNAAQKNPDIVAVTAAMKDGTGLSLFAKKYPQRFFDVGICEQHAVTLCAGLSAAGCKPYFCVYSTFISRAYDQIINDVCIESLPVTFLIDRAGLSGKDGVTHHGVFDVSMLSSIPNMTIYTPKDMQDFNSIIEFSLSYNAPLAIRYSNGYKKEFDFHSPVIKGKWEVLTAQGQAAIITYGANMLHIAFEVRKILAARNINLQIINAAFIKPVDAMMLNELSGKCIVLEECMPNGSLYSVICSYISQNNLSLNAYSVSLPDRFITHGENSELQSEYGITAQNIAGKVKNIL